MGIDFWAPLFFIFLVGLCFGSFMNVVILRAFSNESIAYPASKCPKCQKPLYWWHNIPVLSYILLKGKCYFCKSPISIQYPVVELLTAVLFSLAFVKFGMSFKLLFIWAVIFMALVLAISDIKEKAIFLYHALILGGIGLVCHAVAALWGLLTGADLSWLNNPFTNSVEGLLLAAAVMVIYFLVAGLAAGGKMAMGDGDIYIASALGACLGFEKTAYMLVIGFILQILITFLFFERHLVKTKDYKMFGALFAFIAIVISYYFANENGIFANNIILLLLCTITMALVALYILIDIFKKVWSLKDKTPDAVLENFECYPFGPALVAGAIITMFFASEISSVVQNLLGSY